MWSQMKAIDWAHLPNAGGLLDQDELLMTNIFTIQWEYEVLKAHDAANKN